ncbi:MAG TPA: hypothetical protein VFG50_04750 [Rhodothermales bacterium]|nr:hypothetical protein [Rhodothermales bacterium]
MFQSRVDTRGRACRWMVRWALACSLLAGWSTTAHAQAVDAVLTVSDGAQARELRVGLDPGATQGLDAGLGEVELPPMPPSGVFEARLVGDDVQAPLGQGTYKDDRTGDAAFVGEVVHELRFQRGDGSGIVISWSLPAGVSGRIQDLSTGALINRGISDAGSFAVPNVGIDRLKLTLSYGGGAERADVDIPFLVSDGTHAQQLHVGLDLTASSGLDHGLSEAELPPMPPAGIFEARLIGDDVDVSLGQGTYRDYRNGGELFVGSMTHEIRFQRATPEDTVTVSWVLPDDVSGILVDAGGEDLVNREIRGEGSVKVTAPSVDRLRLTLSYEPSRSRAAEVNYALIVSDGSEARKLFFGLDPGATEGLDAGLGEIELPPMPPSGVFEARLVGDDVQVPLGQGTYKDYRTGDASFTGEVVHELRFQRGDGSGIVISWSLPDGVFGR